MAALVADQCGHDVSLYDADSRIGGQLNMARVIPGKEEFHGLVEWFQTMLDRSRVNLHLNTRATPERPWRPLTKPSSPPASPRATRR